MFVIRNNKIITSTYKLLILLKIILFVNPSIYISPNLISTGVITHSKWWNYDSTFNCYKKNADLSLEFEESWYVCISVLIIWTRFTGVPIFYLPNENEQGPLTNLCQIRIRYLNTLLTCQLPFISRYLNTVAFNFSILANTLMSPLFLYNIGPNIMDSWWLYHMD